MAIVDKIRNRLSRSSKDDTADGSVEELPPLRQVDLPKVKPAHYRALAEQGWTTVTFSGTKDPLKQSLETLFQASKEGSEDGWNRIEGEKEFITLRTIENTPKELKHAAVRAWSETGKLLNEMLGLLAKTLDLPPEALTQYSSPCTELNSNKTATMLRLFRYEGREAKVVAEPHADLGLLSFVIGDTPGLEVWNRYMQDFWAIEKTYSSPAGSLLGGRQLERLSNGRYPAGGHLVRAYGSSTPKDQPASISVTDGPYRYSIVFVLRAHSPVPIDTDALTTSITGPFASPMKDMTAGQLFMATKRQHFNVNTHTADREKQKKEIAARREAEKNPS